jgi:hypothetical protein
MLSGWKIAAALGASATLASPALAQNVMVNQMAANMTAYAIINDLGNLSVGGANGADYTWSSRGFTFQLAPREKHYTQQEAIQVRDALDKLPTPYLQKACATGVHIFYRDHTTPGAPWNWIVPPAGNIVAVAVPPAPWNFIALTDEVFSSANETYRICTHELGHCVEWNETGWGILLGCDFTNISWLRPEPAGFKSWNGFVTNYARTNQREDYAESCCYYWLANAKLKSINPTKWQYMHDRCFGGVVPDASKEVDLGTVGPVTPQIGSLSASDHDPGMPCTVHGTYFMGPFDGGFNTVWVRNTTALHVPVSEQTMWFTTPFIDAGSAPVRVQTQDGWSNQAGYAVDKPWYQFW